MSLIFGLVFCRVGKATPKQNDQRVVFYVFGSEDIYIVDPKTKAILSTIGPDGVCTKSNNRYSRWACLNDNVCRNFSHSLPWCKYISGMKRSVSSPDETRLKDWEDDLKIRRAGAAEYFWRTSRCFIWWWNIVSQCLILLLKHWKWFYKEKSRMQKWAVFHLISKHSLNINFLCIFFLTY